MDIFKGGYFGNYGEWGGANLDVTTSADIPNEYTELTIGFTYQHRFTFNDFIKDQEHNSSFGDIFGYGVDRRKFQNDIVDAPTLQSFSRQEAALEGAKLENTWPLEVVTAGPGYNVGFSFGRILERFEDGTTKLSTANSIIYSRMQGGWHFNRGRFEEYVTDDNGNVIEANQTNFMTDGIFTDEARVQAHTDWFLRVDDDNEFDASLIYSHEGANTTLSRYFVSLGREVDVYAAQYGLKAKSMLLGRFKGSHEILVDTDIDWNIGFGIFARDEPDLRRTGGQRNLGAEEGVPYLLLIPESSKADNGARFASEMDDKTFAARVDVDHDFIDDELELKLGILYDHVSRDFGARLITGAKDDFTNPELRTRPLRDLPIVWEPENFEREDGYFLVDGTTPFESYEASNDLIASYIGVEWNITPRVAVSAGGRYENFIQKLDTDTLSIDNTNDNFLPTVSLAYHTDKFAVKFGYSRSVNRPAFRELSPFIFYDFDYRSDIQGNPGLKNAILDNFDLALEYIFGRNEYFTLTPFFKRIKDPIEMQYIIRSESALFSFNNVEEANVGGVELEFGKFLGSRDIWRQLFFTGSLTYSDSRVNLGEDTAEAVSERPLQGQSRLIASGGLSWFSTDQRSQISLLYRYRGLNLFSVGDGVNTYPWYNMPINLLSASFSHKFGDHLKLTLVGRNLLNTPFVQREDANLDGKLDNDLTDNEVQRGLQYQTYDLQLTYSF